MKKRQEEGTDKAEILGRETGETVRTPEAGAETDHGREGRRGRWQRVDRYRRSVARSRRKSQIERNERNEKGTD